MALKAYEYEEKNNDVKKKIPSQCSLWFFKVKG